MKRREMLSNLALGGLPFIMRPSEFVGAIQSHTATATGTSFGDGRDWFLHKRYGMFVHWGLYAIPAWHEQYQWRAGISRNEYAKWIHEFNPRSFDPEKWLDLLQEAGMEYLTFTTKHHDGFCMWDTAQTTFNVMHSPYGKDVLRLLSDACHKRKIPLCLYYSIVDWHHPNYPNRGRHHELAQPEPGDKPDWNRYMHFLEAQVKELCSNYGEIHGFWWDMNVPQYKDPSVNAMIRRLQPKAVINNRGFDDGDFGTPERDFHNDPSKRKLFDRLTEACQSVGTLSWGYKKDEEYYSDGYLMKSIDEYLCANANYLLNIGPDAAGSMPAQPSDILRRIGKWYRKVRESYVDARYTHDLIAHKEVLMTTNDRALYVHFNKELTSEGFGMKPMEKLPVGAVLLNTGQPVECVLSNIPLDYPDKRKYLRLHLPVNELAGTVPVVRLIFDK